MSGDPVRNSRMMRALRCEPVDCTPVWMMRQAGRYMSEYRAVRERDSFLGLCRNPDRCAEVMLTAVEKLDVDAAIIFSDLLPILQEMGMDLEFLPGEGPVIHNPILDASGVGNLRPLHDVQRLGYVFETVRKTRAGLAPGLPLIGFAGAPFTLASYAIEGGASRNYLRVKTLMYTDPGAWAAIMETLTDAVSSYLVEQIRAGADVVQMFDSWVGCLGPGDYERSVLPYSARVVRRVRECAPDVPFIHFTTGNPALLGKVADAGADCVGVDWRVELDLAWNVIGRHRAIQGNLDPAVLLADLGTLRERAGDVLRRAAGRPGHIFNLGHGVHPQTPVRNAIELVKIVRELSLGDFTPVPN